MSDSQHSGRLLDGVRILDFTCNAAGPYAAWLLGSLGAEIAKVESTQRPDPARGTADRPYRHSVFYEDINGGKRCVDLDLKSPEGVDAAMELAGACDVVIDSFRPGVMARLGLGPSALLERHPHLVVASLSATGSEGPYAGLPGYAGIFNALGGLGGLTGYPDGPPTELRTSVDLRCGAVFASLIALALGEAADTGHGKHLDFSAVEAVALLAGEHVAAALMDDRPVVPRIGNEDELWSVQDVFGTADGQWLVLTVRDHEDWARLAERAGDGLPSRDRAGVAALVESRSLADLLALFAAAAVPAETVADAAMVANDPHLRARNFFQEVSGIGGVDRHVSASAPWTVDGQRAAVGAMHELGEDTDIVLEEWIPTAGAAPRKRPEVLPVRGAQVLELGVGAAVPFAGRMLANLGADVLKVELGPHGDWARRRPPLVTVDGHESGALFHHLNAGKQGRTVTEENLDDTLAELWSRADIVLVDETFLAHTAVVERLAESGPRVVAVVTPFGLEGPESGRAATPATLFARCGEGSITPAGLGREWFPDGPPLVARGMLAAFDSGVVATLVSAAALHGGVADRPQVVDIATYEVEVSVNRWMPSNYSRSGWIGTRDARPYPYGGLIPCRDGFAMFLPSTNGHWAAFLEIMGKPDWAMTDELSTYAGRASNAAVVREGIGDWASTKTMAELFELGLRHGVPIGPYRSAEEVAACPQLRHRNFFMAYGEAGARLLPGVPAPGVGRAEPLAVAPVLGADCSTATAAE